MVTATQRLPVIPPRPTCWFDPVCVYRFYDSQGVLLYVGITGSPAIRFGAHRAASAWWSRADLSRTRIYWRENQALAEAEEVAAIIVERPVFNIAHRPGPRIVNRQVPVPGVSLTEFRKNLTLCIEGAVKNGEVTIVKHGSRNIARAALVPFDVGSTPVPIANGDDVRSYLVSPEWFQRAQEALGEATHDSASDS
jgi:hypothetical protein